MFLGKCPKQLLLLINVLLLLIILLGWNHNGYAEQVTLSWDRVTTIADVAPINDLAGYKISYGKNFRKPYYYCGGRTNANPFITPVHSHLE